MNYDPYCLSNKMVVETPENIYIEFEVAGLASRFIAYFIDTMIQIVLVYLIYYLLFLIPAFFGASGEGPFSFSKLTMALMVIIVFIIFQGYFIFLNVLERTEYW